MSSAISAAELGIKEGIYGLLKKKDINSKGSVHSSDFQAAVAVYGLSMGSSVVQAILVNCTIDRNGEVNYRSLGTALATERSIMSERPDKAFYTQSSKAAVPKPWVADETHVKYVQSEIQLKLMRSRRKELQDAYDKYVHNVIDEDTFVGFIQSLNMTPTREFQNLLRKNRSCSSTTFNKFYRALSVMDAASLHTATSFEEEAVPAGKSSIDPNKRENDPAYKELGMLSKRQDLSKRQAGLFQKLTQSIPVSSPLTPNRSLVSTNMTEAMTNPQFSTVPLFSTAEAENAQNIDVPDNARYDSELRTAREKVLAALRKVDTEEISVSEFHDVLYKMKIEPPESLVVLLQARKGSGHLNFGRCVKILDSDVFKGTIVTSDAERQKLSEVKERFLRSLTSRSANSLSQLAITAKLNADESEGTGIGWTLTQFQSAYSGIVGRGRGGVSEEEVRLLFIAMDETGGGQVSPSRMLDYVRGPIPSRVVNSINTCFKKLDRTGSQSVMVDTLLSELDPSHHPDVLSGIRSETEVVRELISTLGKKVSSDLVTKEEFTSYYSNLSSFYADDESFAEMMKQCWGLSEKNPAPPLLQSKLGFCTHSPIGKQTHGDIVGWNNEPSPLEKEKKIGVMKTTAHDSKLDVFRWNKTTTSELKKAGHDEWKLQGGMPYTSSYKGDSTSLKEHLRWNTAKRPQKTLGGIMSELSIASDENNDTVQQAEGAEEEMYFSKKGYKWSHLKMQHLATDVPFGEHDSSTTEMDRGRSRIPPGQSEVARSPSGIARPAGKPVTLLESRAPTKAMQAIITVSQASSPSSSQNNASGSPLKTPPRKLKSLAEHFGR